MTGIYKKIIAFSMTVITVALCACSNGQQPVSEEERLYQSLFNLDEKIEIKIDIDDSELAKMEADYEEYEENDSKSPIYRKADKVTFTIGGESYEIDEVGVRMKGNLSLTDFYDEKNSDMYNLIHLKLSFDETFDDEKYYGDDANQWESTQERDERKKRTFATLNGIDLKWNKNYDQTYIREYYSNEMFRENNVVSPKMNLAATTFGGVYCGVFTLYEQVDNNFIERNFPEEDWGGDLYKVAWTRKPANYTMNVTYGIEDADEGLTYNFDLKTNKNTSKHESLENLLDVINDDNVTKESFESVVDKESFLNFAAVSYFTGNPDDMRNNYNNHYVYFRKSDGKAVFIPYDNDRVLGICVGWNPTGSGMTEVSPFSSMAAGNRSKQVNPLYRLTILNDDCYYPDEYTQKIKQLSESEWLTEDNFNERYEKAKANYADCTKPDKNFNNADTQQFEFSLDGVFDSGDEENMSIKEYFDRIKETVDSELE